MQVKAYAAGMGADIDWDEDWFEQADPIDTTLRGNEIAYLPIGLGYESS